MSKKPNHTRRTFDATPSPTDRPTFTRENRLTPEDVLDTPAAVRSMEVRTVAPAIVLVAEIGAPLRLEVIGGTHGEAAALRTMIETDERVSFLMDIYRCERDDFGREEEHASRLSAGQTITKETKTHV